MRISRFSGLASFVNYHFSIINNPSTKHSSKKQTKETSREQKTKKNGVVGLYFGINFWKISADRTYRSNPDCMDDQIQVSDNYKISL